MAVAPGVSLGDVEDGDVASVHYTRTVTFTVGNARVTRRQHNRGTSGAKSGRHCDRHHPDRDNRACPEDKLPEQHRCRQQQWWRHLHDQNDTALAYGGHCKVEVGDSVTVNVSPIVATSVAKCGLFGKGLFGCSVVEIERTKPA